jgi:hypothetical protein
MPSPLPDALPTEVRARLDDDPRWQRLWQRLLAELPTDSDPEPEQNDGEPERDAASANAGPGWQPAGIR